jgi:hypothetical protein
MAFYPSYTTTVVGAHSVPRWYEALDLPRHIALAKLRAMTAAKDILSRQ